MEGNAFPLFVSANPDVRNSIPCVQLDWAVVGPVNLDAFPVPVSQNLE